MFLCVHTLLSLGTIPSSGTAGSYGNSMFTSLRKCQTVSQIDASFYFLTRTIYRSQPFPFLANTCYLLLSNFFFNSSHPSRLKLYLTGVLVAFPWWLVVLSTFSWMQWPLVYLLWKNIYSDLFPIFLSWIICFFFNWVMYSL